MACRRDVNLLIRGKDQYIMPGNTMSSGQKEPLFYSIILSTSIIITPIPHLNHGNPLKAAPFDPSLNASLSNFPNIPPLSQASVPQIRRVTGPLYTAEKAFSDSATTHSELTNPGPDDTEIKLAIVHQSAPSSSKPHPAIYFIHGGGLEIGNRFICAGPVEWVKDLDVVFVSVEYRVSPEYIYPIPLEDCFEGLKYVAENAESLGIDADRIMAAGVSGGGSLAAGVTLLARDRGCPKIHP
ncbi:hypothetical protein IFR05_010953 [Cadophora sp. M221]|nr:hypothetical protein IFR05_010953 [Cadophora sp. M221]